VSEQIEEIEPPKKKKLTKKKDAPE